MRVISHNAGSSRGFPQKAADRVGNLRAGNPFPVIGVRRGWRRMKQDRASPATAADQPNPAVAARAVGLRYVADDMPGIRRRRAGRAFSYRDAKGRLIKDRREIARLKRLAIPPAWTDVWICPDGKGHLQATGRDAKGRKQYRYHPDWRTLRDAAKFDRMLAFARALPRLRARVAEDQARRGLPREKVLATVVRLLEVTLIRVGNQEYARDNRSYGLTTMRDRHVDFAGAEVIFEYRGKGGRLHRTSLRDRRLARIVRSCQEIPGQQLFQYIDEEGQRQAIDSADVNAYLQESPERRSRPRTSAPGRERCWPRSRSASSRASIRKPPPSAT